MTKAPLVGAFFYPTTEAFTLAMLAHTMFSLFPSSATNYIDIWQSRPTNPQKKKIHKLNR